MPYFDYNSRTIKGVILDITGVLKESGPNGATAIQGSIEAVNRLYNSGLQVRFCTNETTVTRHALVDQLRRLGFSIEDAKVFPPIPAVCQILREKNLRPHLLVHPDSLPDFSGVDQSNPNCVVVGDATHQFSYDNLNTVFQFLMEAKEPVLFSLGSGRYYQEENQLLLDVGPYVKALEYATDLKAEVVGKPSVSYFTAVLNDMGTSSAETVMVGDDIVSDVGGAQACGMAGVLVRTGKYRSRDESHPSVKPDGIVDNLAHFVDLLLKRPL